MKKDFPIISAFGTIGAIIINLFIGYLGYSGSIVAFQIGAVSFLLNGIYIFTLPKTPPLAKGRPISARDWFFIDAFKLLKNRNYLVFLICTVFLFTPLTAYASYAPILLEAVGFKKVNSVLSIGQMCELVFMLLLPLFVSKLRYKYVFLIGILAMVARCILFAVGAPEAIRWSMYLAIGLHGFCWNFFFVAGFMYTDENADPKIKSQAQGLLMLFSQGIGIFLGSMLSSSLFKNLVTSTKTNSLAQWGEFWTYMGIFTSIIALIFCFLFQKKEKGIKVVEKSNDLIDKNII
ncbi:MFS transporter [Priestia megaterium]|uniref:MFS transporter n=1 Tax=Priestia megaterium TaxID=1404 RepID=UPI00221F8ED0|nr:MFS transporter [Priestia megaterium]